MRLRTGLGTGRVHQRRKSFENVACAASRRGSTYQDRGRILNGSVCLYCHIRHDFLASYVGHEDILGHHLSRTDMLR